MKVYGIVTAYIITGKGGKYDWLNRKTRKPLASSM